MQRWLRGLWLTRLVCQVRWTRWYLGRAAKWARQQWTRRRGPGGLPRRLPFCPQLEALSGRILPGETVTPLLLAMSGPAEADNALVSSPSSSPDTEASKALRSDETPLTPADQWSWVSTDGPSSSDASGYRVSLAGATDSVGDGGASNPFWDLAAGGPMPLAGNNLPPVSPSGLPPLWNAGATGGGGGAGPRGSSTPNAGQGGGGPTGGGSSNLGLPSQPQLQEMMSGAAGLASLPAGAAAGSIGVSGGTAASGSTSGNAEAGTSAAPSEANSSNATVSSSPSTPPTQPSSPTPTPTPPPTPNSPNSGGSGSLNPEILPDDSSQGIQFVQANSQTWSAVNEGSLSLSFDSDVQAGDLLLVTLGTSQSQAIPFTVTDTLGNTYNLLAKSDYSQYGEREIYAFGAIASSSGPDTINLSYSSYLDCELGILEYSGVKSSDYVDGTSQNIDGGTTLTTGTIPVSHSGDLIVGIFSSGDLWEGQFSAGSGFNERCNPTPDFWDYPVGLVEDELNVDSATAATATYDIDNGADYAALGLSIEPGSTATTTTLSASNSSPAPGQAVAFTALVQPQAQVQGTPTGTVDLQLDGSDIDQESLQPGQNWVTFHETVPAVASGGSTPFTYTAVYSGDPNFDSSQGSDTLTVGDPALFVPGSNCNCGCPDEPGSVPKQSASPKAPTPSSSTGQPVRYADGVVTIAETDLYSAGFGFPWAQTRSWTNGPGYSNGVNGNGWVDTYTPQLIQADGSTNNTLIVIANGTTAYYFTLVNGSYQAAFGDPSQLTYNSSNDTYTLIDGVGDQIVFDGFASSWQTAQRGQFQSYTDADGVTTNVTSYTSDGHIAEMQRAATSNGQTVTEAWLFSYLPSTDINAGFLSNVTLQRQVNGGAWSTVQQVAYTYYDGTQEYGGNVGDLMTATALDGSGDVLQTSYYRYYTPGQANGYAGALEYVFNPASYAGLTAALGTDLGSLSDAQVAPYADNYFQYDSQQRVTQEVAAGAGDSQTSGGLGTYTFSYTASSNAPGYNSWAMKTVVTNPDGSTDTVYTNAYAEVMLDDHYDPASGLNTDEFYAYNSQGQLILDAAPSAVSGYNDTYADLLDNVNGAYQYLNNNSGLLTRYDYYTTTTADETTAGGVVNYLEDAQIQQGQQGTLIPQETWQYYAHASGGQTLAPVATDTVYRNDDGTGAETTTYTYTWYGDTSEIASQTESDPVVTGAQNGPGTPDVTTTDFDLFANTQWVQDPDGYLQYYAYDLATGAQVTQIVDVNTAEGSEFTNLPTGWSTPSGGGLNLVTTDVVDALGRTTEEISPNGNITYYVYLDPQHEERIYEGWNSSTGMPTGPTEVIREDAADGYTETLTMSATPNLNADGTPNGSEAIGNLQSLARDYTNDAGQIIAEDAYFNLGCLSYSTGVVGTVNVNYYQTQYGYDSGGSLARMQTPNGTIYRTVYNSLGEEVSDWVGTNDTPASGEWSPSNNTGTSNMVMVSSYVYDNGGVGDGNLTQETDYPGLGAAPRVTDSWYDWRDRLVAQKSGVESSENDGVNRPILVTTYDNLDEAIQTQQYEGDGVTPQIVNGVLQALAPSLLRALEIDSYDNQGSVYQTQVFDVNPKTGAVSSSALTTNFYYDHRGDLIAESDPGGLWYKSQYDGAGRDVMDYTTDGGSGTTWAEASSVTNDTVLEQEQTIYDGDGNPIETIDSQRFDNATGAGPLGTPISGIGARVYYAAEYYDNADRLIADVDAGTNGGTAWTRSSSVPSSSSTLLVTQYVYNAAGYVQDTIDPMGVDDRTLYDNLGRTTQTIQDYTDGVETAYSNITTEYGYDGNDNTLYVRADEPGGAFQQTNYVYGVTTASSSGVNSNDILSTIEYPDPSTGQPSTSQQESYLVNALGQTVQYTDRNGNVHQYNYDVLGRLTSDAVTTLGAGVDGSVRRIEYGYDSQSNLSLITSYDAASGGNIVNQVLRQYNGLDQLTAEYQGHHGAVDTSQTGTVQTSVQYVYNEMANGENNSRLVSIIYPSTWSNARYTLSYNYAAGLDDRISRLSSLTDNSPLSNGATLESYKYLGLGTVVERDHPQINTNETYISQNGQTGDAGDPYVGLDRFGRVVNDNWVNTSTGQSTDDFVYGYNADGDVLYRQNLVDAAMSELYQYNSLDELVNFQRGTLNSSDTGIVGTPSASQSWTPDAVGNFDSVTTNGSTQTETFNQQNQIASISGSGTVLYDNNGNLTADGSGNTYVYDAWDRLVAMQNNGTTVASYSYDGLGRRIAETHGSNTRELYYSADGQVLTEWYNGLEQARNVWSPVAPDTLVLRDQARQDNGVLNDRFYVQQDANGNVTALVNAISSYVVERYAYTPYGVQTVLNPDFTVRGTSSYNVPYGFQGLRTDATVRLNFADNRVYDPTLMRWLQTDPLGLNAGTNDYEFVGDGPIDQVDPLGLGPWDLLERFQDGLGQLGRGLRELPAATGRAYDRFTESAGNLARGRVNPVVVRGWEKLWDDPAAGGVVAGKVALDMLTAAPRKLGEGIATGDRRKILEGGAETGLLYLGGRQLGRRLQRPCPAPGTQTSGLSVLPRRGMTSRTVTAPNGRTLRVWGQGEASTSTTPGHAEAMNNLVNRLAATGEYEYATIQRSWRTATGRVGGSGRIPDVIGVRRNGVVDAWEVRSATDDAGVLLRRLEEGLNTLPSARRGRVRVIPPEPPGNQQGSSN